MNKRFGYLVVFLLVLPMCLGAMIINPLKYEITDVEFNKTYNIVITALNPDTAHYDVQVMVNKASYYLLDNVQIEPMHFIIGPNDKENLKLAISIPNTLSPEEHELYLDFITANHELGKFKLSFIVPGEKDEDIVVNRIIAEKLGDLIYFNFDLTNNGNVIAKGSPIVEIYDETEMLEIFGEESTIMIMPGDSYNLSLMYDTSSLIPGKYKYIGKFRYNDLETNYTEGDFSVEKKKESEYKRVESVYEGDNLIVNLTMKNPSGDLSFYKIQYNIFDQGIGDTLEGPIQGRQKNLDMDIDTSKLAKGNYELEINIMTGRELEDIETKIIYLKVKSKKQLYGIGIGIAVLVFTISLIFIRPKLAARPVSRNIQKEIDRLSGSYANLETQAQEFTSEVNNFIVESNNWLSAQGYNYGFR